MQKQNNFAPIGITGLKRSGKNTVGAFIEKHHISNCMQASFADPIRAISICMGFTHDQINVNKNEVNEIWEMSWRTFAQQFGTDIMRNRFQDDVWIKLGNQQLIDNPTKKLVFTDIRFPNEAKLIRDMGGIVILVNRPEAREEDSHSSEQGILTGQVDYVINNLGNLVELEMETVKLLRHLDCYKPSISFEKVIRAFVSCVNCKRKPAEAENDN